MTQAERTRTIKYVLADSSRWLLHRRRDTKKINTPPCMYCIIIRIFVMFAIRNVFHKVQRWSLLISIPRNKIYVEGRWRKEHNTRPPCGLVWGDSAETQYPLAGLPIKLVLGDNSLRGSEDVGEKQLYCSQSLDGIWRYGALARLI